MINHLDLSVSDLTRSTEFYASLLGSLGYRRVENDADGGPNWVLRAEGVLSSIGLHPASESTRHTGQSPGLHHLAFHAESREQVDELYSLLLASAMRILDPPAEYDYSPGYYAVFFADPDGMKLEMVHEPVPWSE
ncbi:MAG: VOC family protein [Chromatiales bacterium]|nr:VOC family protein [Chromatiales bacterium]